MTKGQESPTGGFARTAENRSCARRKLTTMAYVELGQDNGGILLNLGEGGLAVQSALTLAGPEFPDIRFQLPNSKRWLLATGRVTWMSDSRTEAGIQFLDLRPETRAQIRRWVATTGEELSTLAPTQAAKPTDSPRAAKAQGNGGSFSRPATGATTVIDEGNPAAQDFRFNDYSMFSVEGGAQHIAIEPARSRWKSFALLAICLAILFFVLGASFGRYTFDQWLQPRAPEQQAPTVPGVGDTAALNPGTNAAPQTDSQKEKTEGQTRVPGPSTETAADSHATAEQNTPDKKEEKDVSSDASGSNDIDPGNAVKTAPEASAKSDNAGPKSVAGGDGGNFKSLRRDARPFQSRPQSTYRDVGAQNDEDSAHSILVNAPAPGNPAFFVNLTNEAVGASQWVAISAARSVWIGPKPNPDGFGRAERVTIGRLLSHSEPFYPQEARAQRLEGSVVLRATFGRTGTPVKVTPVSGPSLLASAAMSAVREWRYAPTFIDGDPVETQADITMVFRLR
jgi:TonB family protein